MKYLVTGVAGFVGSNIAGALLDAGQSVRGIDCFTDYYDEAIKQGAVEPLILKGLELITADINKVDLGKLLKGIDVVIHQAGQPGVRKSWGSDFSVYLDQNVAATQMLLEACRRSETLQRFVYASSSSVYGNAERYPTLETDRPRPMSPYGVTKLAAEHLVSLYAENFGVPTVSLRYFTVYGPGQRPDMAFTRFVKAAVRGEKITIFGDGEQVRDFTYVSDIVQANLAAASSAVTGGSVYNVAGGSNISVNGVLALLSEIAGHPLDIEYVDGVQET